MVQLYGPSGGPLIRPPRAGTWWELLPEPWDENPYVVVVMAANDSKSRILEQKGGGYTLGCLEVAGRVRGLQVIHPQMATYPAHSDVFEQCRIDMIDPHYVGKLSGIREELLLSDGFAPLLFQRDAMYRPYLHLRRFIDGITKKDNKHVN